MVLRERAAGTAEATVIINILPSMLSSLMTNLGVQVIPNNTADLLLRVRNHITDQTATHLPVALLHNQDMGGLNSITQLRQEIGTVGSNSRHKRGITVRRPRECKKREDTNQADIMVEGRRHQDITKEADRPLLDTTQQTTLPQDTAHSSPKGITQINIVKGDINIKKAILVIIHSISQGLLPRAVGVDSRGAAERLAVGAPQEGAALGPRLRV